MKVTSSRSRVFHMLGMGLVVVGLPVVSACYNSGSQSQSNRNYSRSQETVIMDSSAQAPSRDSSSSSHQGSGYSRYTGSAPAPQPGTGPRVMNSRSQSAPDNRSSQPVNVDSGSTSGIKIPSLNKSK